MGSLSDYAENKLLDHIFGKTAYTPVATIYLGLSTTDPGDTSPGGEPSGSNYARIAIAFNAGASRKIENTSILTFNQASGPWGTIGYWFLCDHATNVTWGSNVQMLAAGSFTTPKAVVSGNTPSIAANEVDVEFSALEISNYLALKVLDFMFRNQAFTQPSVFAALATADLSDTTTGSTITEVSGSAYTRKRHQAAGWADSTSGATKNMTDLTFPTPSGSWGLVTAAALVDASTAGNILFYENTLTDQTPTTGDTVKFPAGDFDVSLT
jgi:hypothetical protein